MTLGLYRRVRFLGDHPAEGVTRGTVGWIIEIHDDPTAPDGKAYEVEVVGEDGLTVALVVARAHELELL